MRPTPWAKTWRKRITAFIDKQVGLGGQAYVVCPLIEDSENAETKLKSAEQHAKDLQKLLPHRAWLYCTDA